MRSRRIWLSIFHTLVTALLGCTAVDTGTTAKTDSPETTSARQMVRPPSILDGRWRLRARASSFMEGRLGYIDRPISIKEGQFASRFRDGTFDLAITFSATDSAIKGRIAVAPSMAWDYVTIPFQGNVVDGVLDLKLSGTTSVKRFGLFLGERDTRTIDIHLRLERR